MERQKALRSSAEPLQEPLQVRAWGVPDSPSTSPRFSKVVEECLGQQEHEGVSTKTIDDKRSVASLLVRIIGDMPIDLITRQDARKFRETALKLPPRLNQLPEGLAAWAGCSPSIELG